MVRKLSRAPEGSPFSEAEWAALGIASREWAITALAALHEVAELRARLRLNSTNSSKPPSSDPPQVKKPKKPPTGRRPGGQPGHPGHSRSLVPPERVNEFQDFSPEDCRGCGADFSKQPEGDLEPLREQVAEIPAIEPHVLERRCHRVCCSACGTVTTAQLPEGVPQGSFGPNLRALLVVLSGRFRLSRREVQEFCGEALGLAISVGCLDNMCRKAGEVLLSPYEEAKERIQAAPHVHLDESGWKQHGVRHWVWVAVTGMVAFFQIAKSRGSEVVVGMLGLAFSGLTVTDRWSAYFLIPAERRQICWSHLLRDLRGFFDRGGTAKAFGEKGVKLAQELFAIWHRYQRAEFGRRRFQEQMGNLEDRFGELLGDGLEWNDKKVRGFSKRLADLGPALFLFARVPGIEPTNNLAERMLRPIVLWRKGTFGTWSDGGSRFVERMMTVVMTCRLQGQSVLAYLRDVLQAEEQGRKIPSLFEQPVRDSARVGETLSSQKKRSKAG